MTTYGQMIEIFTYLTETDVLVFTIAASSDLSRSHYQPCKTNQKQSQGLGAVRIHGTRPKRGLREGECSTPTLSHTSACACRTTVGPILTSPRYSGSLGNESTLHDACAPTFSNPDPRISGDFQAMQQMCAVQKGLTIP